MRPGNKFYSILFLLFILPNLSFADDKIISSPLLNIEKIKPSFELSDDENENVSVDNNLKEKKK